MTRPLLGFPVGDLLRSSLADGAAAGGETQIFIGQNIHPADPIAVTLRDADRNEDPAATEQVTVTLLNLRTGESEALALAETGVDSGEFAANLGTSESAATGTDDDGDMNVIPGDVVRATYAAINPPGTHFAQSVVLAEATGTVAQIAMTPMPAPGAAVTVTVTDPDANTDPAALQDIMVTVENGTTGESEALVLAESGNDTGVFTGLLATADVPGAGSDDDGVMNVQAGDVLTARYVETAPAGERTAETIVTVQAIGALSRWVSVQPQFAVSLYQLVSGATDAGTINDGAGNTYVFPPDPGDNSVLNELPFATNYVTQLKDQAGSGFTFDQSVLADMPLIQSVADATGQSPTTTRYIAALTGGDSYMLSSSKIEIGSNDYVLLVVRHDNGGTVNGSAVRQVSDININNTSGINQAGGVSGRLGFFHDTGAENIQPLRNDDNNGVPNIAICRKNSRRYCALNMSDTIVFGGSLGMLIGAVAAGSNSDSGGRTVKIDSVSTDKYINSVALWNGDVPTYTEMTDLFFSLYRAEKGFSEITSKINYDVFVFAGDSQMNGDGGLISSAPDINAGNTKKFGPNFSQPHNSTLSTYTKEANLIPSFVNKWHELGGRPCIAIELALSGSGMQDECTTQLSVSESTGDVDNYGNMIAYVQWCLARLWQLGTPGTFRGVVSIVGGNDALQIEAGAGDASYAGYLAELQDTVNAFAEDYPEAGWFQIQTGGSTIPSQNTFFEGVQAQEEALAADANYPNFHLVELTDGTESYDDTVHWDQMTLNHKGEAAATAIAALI